MRQFVFLAWMSLTFLNSAVTSAQPAQISLQGILLDSGGSPVAGPVSMVLRLYANASTTIPVFSETHASVPLTNGVYNVNLGSGTNLNTLDFARDLWLGIKIGSDPELSPRTLLTAAPTAMTLTLPTKMKGTASTTGTAALVVQNLATTGQNYAIQALSESSAGRAIYGYATHGSGANFGVYGLSRSSAGIGVGGRASATSGSTIGVYGLAEATSDSSTGVKGVATASNAGVGVRGEGGRYGVDGLSPGTGGRFEGNFGIRAHGSLIGGVIEGDVGGLNVGALNNIGNDLVLVGREGIIASDGSYSRSYITLKAPNAVQVEWDDVVNFAVYPSASGGVTRVYGELIVDGAKNARVDTRTYGSRLVYSVESPEVWFEDFGSAKLVDGTARISLEPIFIETVTISPEHPMKVFLQPGGDSPGLFVEKDEEGFTVYERPGGSGSVSFDYRVVAKRRGFETERLRETEE